MPYGRKDNNGTVQEKGRDNKMINIMAHILHLYRYLSDET